MQNFLRIFAFVVFFSIGAAALCGSILSGELLHYYQHKRLLKAAEVSLKKLESLNADYDALLRQLQKDPNLVERIARITFGKQSTDANVIYPKVTGEQLDAARSVLAEESNRPPADVPRWVTRGNEPGKRLALFLAGAALVLITFMFFGPSGKKAEKPPASS